MFEHLYHPLSTEDNDFDQNVSIFPNPTNGQITLANNSNLEIRSVTITDVNGRIVQIIDLEDITTQTTFSVENLAQGMYFVKIEAENTSIVKRIIKQ